METETKKNKIEKIDVAIFLIIFIIFGLALLSFYPGIITQDGVVQIKQAENNSYGNGHPIIHSFIIGNLTKIAGNIWLPALFQIIVFALVWTYSCKSFRKYNNTSKNRIWQIFITIVISVFPLNFMYSITIWKDILYSYMFLLLLSMIYIGIKEKFKYTTFQTVLVSLATVCVMKFRYNGAPIGAIMFAIILILNFVYNKKFKYTIKLIISFALIMILMCIPQWTVNIAELQASAGGVLDSSKIYCMGALLKYDNVDQEMNNDEKEVLNTIMDIDKWKEAYDGYFGSYIFYSDDFNEQALSTKETEKKFNEIFNKYALKYKGTVIKHFTTLNSIWWQVEEKDFMNSVVENNDYVTGGTESRYTTKPILKTMHAFLLRWYQISINHRSLYYTIYRPAFAFYLSLILIIAIMIKNKIKGRKNCKEFLLLILPMILNIGTYIIIMTSQDQRYFYPCCMTEYVLLLIYATEFFGNKKFKKAQNVDEDFNEKLKNKKYPKVLVIIPAYNEGKSIQKVVDKVYNENIKNLDVIVVNDGSKDNTSLEAKKTNAFVVDSPNNLGIGGAVQTGYLYAYQNDYDIAIQIDGDGQHDPKYLNQMIQEVKKRK